MLKKAVVLLFLTLILIPFAAVAQSPADGAQNVAESSEPEPYIEEEFPSWLIKIRRGEVILIGSFPFTMFFSNLGVQLYRYIDNEFSEAYSPSIFGGAQLTALSDDEKKAVLITAVSISAAIAITDFIIGEILDKKAAREKR